MKVIARIYNDYKSKFGIPRQAGLIENENSIIVFEPEFRSPEALRGIEEYNYLWLIWEFSEFSGKEWSPTVRPPRLGGNRRMGVFATRSPHRPNPLGLSTVRFEGIKEINGKGNVIVVSGADLMNGTPIYDIKPYLRYSDCKPDSNNGFINPDLFGLDVEFSENLLNYIPQEKLEVLKKILAQDPRPQYIDDPDRVFGLTYSDFNIKFKVVNKLLTVTDIEKIRTD